MFKNILYFLKYDYFKSVSYILYIYMYVFIIILAFNTISLEVFRHLNHILIIIIK